MRIHLDKKEMATDSMDDKMDSVNDKTKKNMMKMKQKMTTKQMTSQMKQERHWLTQTKQMNHWPKLIKQTKWQMKQPNNKWSNGKDKQDDQNKKQYQWNAKWKEWYNWQ